MKNTLFLLLILLTTHLQATIELHQNWEFRQANKEEWHKATVPGTVHTDLLQTNQIPDPYYRNNEEKVQWIEKEDWEYQTTFDIPEEYYKKENIEITFEGLDTYADIYLNDQKIQSTDNMFRTWTIDIKQHAKKENNKLRIYFHSPIKKALPQYKALPYELPAGNDAADEKLSIFTRKAPYHYGWDWAPRMVTSGIWRPIVLNAWNEAKITNLQINQKTLTKENAEIEAVFTIEAKKAQKANLKIEYFLSNDDDGKIRHYLSDKNDQKRKIITKTHKIKLKKGTQKITIPIEIDEPKKWNPNGKGYPFLYEIKGVIFNENKKMLAQEQTRIGLRTIELVQEKDSIGTSYYFKVNGEPVFMKGANYVPANSFIPSITNKRYQEIIKSAVDANMNMLRVWGGGIYENDVFYDLCDENGLLVWQDFMFACSMYPGDTAFVNNVEKEITQNIQRLRNHPSIALWCGNNEMNVAWHNWGWQKQFGYSPKDSTEIRQNYLNLFEKLIPKTLKKQDPTRPYVSTSPLSNWGTPENFNHSSMHYWGVWHGEEPFTEFKNNVGRFNSEYGFQSFPDLANIESFTEIEGRNLDSEVLQKRQKSYKGNRLLFEYIDRHYKTHKDFESFLYLNQLTQAEGIKYAIEQHRKKMPHCMGTLYWQLNDSWPAISWSSTDYYGNWKALHYFVKKAYQTTIIIPEIEGDMFTVSIVCDGLKFGEPLLIELIDFQGNVLKTDFEHVKTRIIDKNSSKVYFQDSLKNMLPPDIETTIDEYLKDKCFVVNFKQMNNHIRRQGPRLQESFGLMFKEDIERQNFELKYSELKKKESTSATSILYYHPPKDLNLQTPNIEITITKIKAGYGIELSTDNLAKNVYLSIPKEGFFTDNYFDLIPEKNKLIIFETTEIIENFEEQLKIKSLIDSHN